MREVWFIRKARFAVTSNFPYKVLSLLIALALWFIVRDERIETTVTFALDVQASGELMVSNEHLPELTVGVTGTRVALSRLRDANLVHVAKPKNTEPGPVVIRIRPEDLELPAGVDPVSVNPSAASIRLEARVTRRVPVKARILVADGTNFRVRKVTVTPERVRISGPASIVAGIDELWTEAIEVAPKAADPVIGDYAVSLPHKQLRLEDATPVAVRIELEPEPAATPILKADGGPDSSGGLAHSR